MATLSTLLPSLPSLSLTYQQSSPVRTLHLTHSPAFCNASNLLVIPLPVSVDSTLELATQTSLKFWAHMFLHFAGTVLTTFHFLYPFTTSASAIFSWRLSSVLQFYSVRSLLLIPTHFPSLSTFVTLSTQPELLIRPLQPLTLVLSDSCSPFLICSSEVPNTHLLPYSLKLSTAGAGLGSSRRDRSPCRLALLWMFQS